MTHRRQSVWFFSGLLLLLIVVSVSATAQTIPVNSRPHRVIARLNTPFVPEGSLTNRLAVQNQRARIRSAQLSLLDRLRASGQSILRAASYSTIPYLVLEIDSNGLDRLRAQPLVTGVAEDRLHYVLTASANLVVHAPEAWAAGYDGDGFIVAILDDSVDFTHPALTGKAIAEACFSNGGYPPDPYGRPTCPNGQPTQIGPGAAAPTSPYCIDCEHGTHVAGIAAGHDGDRFHGVAPGASIIGINVFSYFPDCGDGWPCMAAWDSDINLGLEYVYTLSSTYPNIAAVNLSLGGGYYTSPAACDADGEATWALVANLRSVGIAVIAAAGNESHKYGLTSPACLSNVISVGATTDADQVASFSNSAAFLDLLAPGVNITSSIPGGGYASWSGTSMATPYVTGTWAILRSISPVLTLDAMLAILQENGQPVLDPANLMIHSRIDVFASLPRYMPPRPPELVIDDQAMLDALQREAAAQSSATQIILVDFIRGKMIVYVAANGTIGIAPVSITAGDDMSALVFGSVTTVTGAAASAALATTVYAELPLLVNGALDRLIGEAFPAGYNDVDYAFIGWDVLSLWVTAP